MTGFIQGRHPTTFTMFSTSVDFPMESKPSVMPSSSSSSSSSSSLPDSLHPFSLLSHPRVQSIREEVAVTHRKNLVEKFLRGEMNGRSYRVQYNYTLECEISSRVLRGGRKEDVFDEESRRLDVHLPQGANRMDLAGSAVEAAKRRETLRSIYKNENEEEQSPSSSPLHYTPSRLINYPQSPRILSLSPGCDYPICRAIVHSLTMETLTPPRRLPPCLFCRTKDDYEKIFEDEKESEEDGEFICEEKDLDSVFMDTPKRSKWQSRSFTHTPTRE